MKSLGAAPAVSVVVAAYNPGRYVEAAVRSVLEQSMPDLEIIVVDDGSTDNTAAVVESFMHDPRVHLIRQKNAGQPRAKNAGLRAARGRFIAFCDADDLWVKDKLEKQLPAFDSDARIGVVYSQVATIDPEGRRTGEITGNGPSGDVIDKLFVENFVPFGSAIVRKDVLDTLGLFDEDLAMGIDWDLWLRVAVHWRFCFIREPLYLYRVWPGQMSRNWRGRYEHAFRIMKKFINNNPGLLSKRVIRRAYADSHVEHGICCAILGGLKREAALNYLYAIRTDPRFFRAWQELAKLALPSRSRSLKQNGN
ncbi:hypothetical protein ACG33_10156 [Steroidobacter denitrificans]|uniref:Glycosyltransferase 2-like domain-containing protein n=1 Tax=Steroidobacter denitrificans TaxID=465721 RepID=A0A127FAL3_STEDE|nr:glycosyltransferase [Steroidobacter denitrificans]AMN47457.1 hypothetical protein ACG33_10156 [Steroidobacter denitrificans]